jgi:hypothetical protein
MMVFGAALIATMILRPEGLFPSRSRRMELHPATDAALPEPFQELNSVVEIDR